ncbi:hypothetical protein CLAIMM_12918 [Cladophialophora immunda]|nr:hypothetical protein CLAIMM_12918 [Cladophialophora immunda]
MRVQSSTTQGGARMTHHRLQYHPKDSPDLTISDMVRDSLAFHPVKKCSRFIITQSQRLRRSPSGYPGTCSGAASPVGIGGGVIGLERRNLLWKDRNCPSDLDWWSSRRESTGVADIWRILDFVTGGCDESLCSLKKKEKTTLTVKGGAPFIGHFKLQPS